VPLVAAGGARDNGPVRAGLQAAAVAEHRLVTVVAELEDIGLLFGCALLPAITVSAVGYRLGWRWRAGHERAGKRGNNERAARGGGRETKFSFATYFLGGMKALASSNSPSAPVLTPSK